MKVTIEKSSDGEYRVPAEDGYEDGAYYTDDKDDAIETAKEMYKGITSKSQITFRTVSEFVGGKYEKMKPKSKKNESLDEAKSPEEQEAFNKAEKEVARKLGLTLPLPKDTPRETRNKFYAQVNTKCKKSNIGKCLDKLKEGYAPDPKQLDRANKNLDSKYQKADKENSGYKKCPKCSKKLDGNSCGCGFNLKEATSHKSVTCPKCSEKIYFDPSKEGETIECPECGKSVKNTHSIKEDKQSYQFSIKYKGETTKTGTQYGNSPKEALKAIKKSQNMDNVESIEVHGGPDGNEKYTK